MSPETIGSSLLAKTVSCTSGASLTREAERYIKLSRTVTPIRDVRYQFIGAFFGRKAALPLPEILQMILRLHRMIMITSRQALDVWV